MVLHLKPPKECYLDVFGRGCTWELFHGKSDELLDCPTPSLCLDGGASHEVWNLCFWSVVLIHFEWSLCDINFLFWDVFNDISHEPNLQHMFSIYAWCTCKSRALIHIASNGWYTQTVSPQTVFGTKTYKVAFWMRKYGSLSWKRTWVWSSSDTIKALDLGSLTKNEKQTSGTLTTRYKDSTGKTRFKGNRHLKTSQQLAV